MELDIRLFIINAVMTLSGVFTIASAIFVYRKAEKSDVVMPYVMLALSVATFLLSHVVGVNIKDPYLSRAVLMFNLVDILIVCSNAHWIFAATGKLKEQGTILKLFYIVGAGLIVFFLLVPDAFLLPSRPKMYFPNYYDGGRYYWIMVLYFCVVAGYATFHALREYFTSADMVLKNRMRYVVAGNLFGFFVGSFCFYLVLDVPIDPVFGSPMSLYLVPHLYATFRYKLVEINIVAKQALIYALIVTIVTSLISVGSFSNLYIARNFPNFPIWVMPIIASFLAILVGVFVWRKMKENDLLKYEFITVVTHKFRTPLTHIKWATELLLSQEQDEAKKHELNNIRESNAKLIDLTSTLIAIADTDRPESSLYRFENFVFGDLVAEVAASLHARVEDRKVAFSLERWDNNAVVKGDRERLKFVAQTLIENAISYSNIGGTVVAAVETDSKSVSLRVKDAGIGIAREELPRLFSKFYRSTRAKAADTEGVGVGLFLVKAIVDRHGGLIEADSPGANQGTTFIVSFPKAKQKLVAETHEASPAVTAAAPVSAPVPAPAEPSNRA